MGFSSHAFRKVLELELKNQTFFVYQLCFTILWGLICPIVLQFRLIFQSLCAEKLEWDSPLPLHYAVRWKKLLNNLTKLRTVSVKRYLFLNPANDRDTVELHGFCVVLVKLMVLQYIYVKFQNRNKFRLRYIQLNVDFFHRKAYYRSFE